MEELLKKKNVILYGKGKKVIGKVETDRPAIRVGVSKKVPLSELKKEDVIPAKINGVETDVFETEEINALAIDRTSKIRPAPGGCSIGHPDMSAGTLGGVVKKDGVRFILSNNHVLANSNDASIGDQTWQPGKADGGGPADTIGHLSEFVPIVFTGDESTCPITNAVVRAFNFLTKLFSRKSRIRSFVDIVNKVDCAISRPIDDQDLSDEILEIGKPTGFAEAALDDKVKKSGRTSGLNEGTVTLTDVVATINYGDKIATFEDQFATTPIASGGDSGSFVLSEDNKVVGLLFAGNDSLTIVNKISNVIDALGLEGG